jgi:hypothetical protein
MLTSVYDRLRSAGRPLELPGEPVSSLAERLDDLREVAELTLRVTEESLPGRAQVEDALQLIQPLRLPKRFSTSRSSGSAARSASDLRPSARRWRPSSMRRSTRSPRGPALLEGAPAGVRRAYAEAKSRESALDFEDLQLPGPRPSCQLNEKVREDARWRFRSILVDEFQDTNRLQCELVDSRSGRRGLLRRATSSSRSIASAMPTSRSSGAPRCERGRPPVDGELPVAAPRSSDVVNHLFGAEFGTEYEPLVAAGASPIPLFGPAVELLVTDKASYREGDVHWRVAEARHVARRVCELVDSGNAAPGEIVLLFAAGDGRRTLRGGAPAGRACRPTARLGAAISGSSRSLT